jgi:hypothetical protein
MSTPLSPDTPGRPLPSFPTQEAAENINEILQALDTYKKKDPAKGSFAQAKSTHNFTFRPMTAFPQW